MLAHDFALRDQYDRVHRLSEYRGRWVVIYFYPKDDTPECTIQACDFRDQAEELRRRNMVVLGVSADPVSSHLEFAKKFDLNFPLLSDVSAATVKAYDAWGLRNFLGEAALGVIRMTYVIDPEGAVAQLFPEVVAKGHVNLILKTVDSLQAIKS